MPAVKESRFLVKLREFAGNPSADKKLARFIGVAHSKITGYKQGRLKPTMHVWGIIRDKFGVDKTVVLFLAALEDQQDTTDQAAAEKMAAALNVARGSKRTSARAP